MARQKFSIQRLADEASILEIWRLEVGTSDFSDRNYWHVFLLSTPCKNAGPIGQSLDVELHVRTQVPCKTVLEDYLEHVGTAAMLFHPHTGRPGHRRRFRERGTVLRGHETRIKKR